MVNYWRFNRTSGREEFKMMFCERCGKPLSCGGFIGNDGDRLCKECYLGECQTGKTDDIKQSLSIVGNDDSSDFSEGPNGSRCMLS